MSLDEANALDFSGLTAAAIKRIYDTYGYYPICGAGRIKRFTSLKNELIAAAKRMRENEEG